MYCSWKGLALFGFVQIAVNMLFKVFIFGVYRFGMFFFCFWSKRDLTRIKMCSKLIAVHEINFALHCCYFSGKKCGTL